MQIRQFLKYDKDYNIIEFIEKDSYGNILHHIEYDEFGNIIFELKENRSWKRASYVHFSCLETRNHISRISYEEYHTGNWIKYEYYDHENGRLATKYNSSNGTSGEWVTTFDNNMGFGISSYTTTLDWVCDVLLDYNDEIEEHDYIEEKQLEGAHLNGEMLFRNRDDWLPP